MGAKLCCSCSRKQSWLEPVPQQSQSCNQIKSSRQSCNQIKSSRQFRGNISKREKAKTEQMMTLEELLLASPCIYQSPRCMGTEDLGCKQISTRVHPSSSPLVNAFFTPRLNFSKTKSLGKIEEVDEEVGAQASMSMTPVGSSSMKKVSFKLPDEADFFFYSPPGESFEE